MPVVCVIGSRVGVSPAKLQRILRRMVAPERDAMWSGGAPGVDSWAAAWAGIRGVPVRVWPAKWRLHGKAAGFRRSAEMVAALPVNSIVVAAVARSLAESRGTAHTVRLARARGLRVFVFEFQGAEFTMCRKDKPR